MFTIFHTFNSIKLTDTEKNTLLKYIELYSTTEER